MQGEEREEQLLRSVALQNAQSISLARQRAEESLRQQTEWLRTTLASIGDAVLSTDADGRVTYLNPVAESLTGWQQAEAVGRPLSEVFRIFNEHTGEPAENPVLRALHEGVVVGLANHSVLVARDGTRRPIDDSAAPLRSGSGPPTGTVLVFRDISERKRADEARARLAALVESSDDAIVGKTLDGVIVSWNAAAQRIFGYTPEEAIGRSITLIIPPERHHEEDDILARLRRGERVEHLETVRVAKDGRRLDISLTSSPIRDTAGRIIGASKIARDVTERAAATRALAESRQRLDYVARVSGVGFWYCDLPFDVLNWDERVKEHFWLPPDARVTIDTFYEHLHPDDREPTRQAIERAIESGVPYDMDYRTVDPESGAIKWIRAIGKAAYGPGGEPTRFDGVTLDVTARKLDEQRLARLYDELREQDRRKDEFLALLAHELRNPLAPIRNGLQVMRLAGGDVRTATRAREMMDRQLSHMVRLVDDLLDISRINCNKMELRRQRVSLTEVVSTAVETARPMIDAAGQELTISLPPQPIYLDADLTRLAQVFSNLLTNSARYTPRGGRIWLTAEPRGDAVAVAVRDTGLGIPAESLPTVFDLFSQVDRGLERSSGGLGIGLALVKGLVEMHGGTVTAESTEGEGSTFTVVLPVPSPSAAQAAAGPPAEAAVASRRILVVDDSRDGAESLAMMLELLGNEVRSAYDGLEAVQAAEAFRPEVILMDVGMPRLNGLDAARRIREQPWGRGMTIIALTGWGQEADRERSREAGCDGHLVKPVELPRLQKLLHELAGGGR